MNTVPEYDEEAVEQELQRQEEEYMEYSVEHPFWMVSPE